MKIRMFGMVLAALFMASSARAQVPWDAPSFMPPRPGDNIGGYVSTLGDVAFQGIWRQSGNMNLGLRLGYIDTPGDGIITVGAETWDLLVAAGDALPVDVAWTLGAGAAFNGGTTLGIPAGLSFGLPIILDQVRLQPYAHPRLGLFVHAVNDDTDLDLEGLFDLGVDASFGGSWTFRLGATFGHRDAVGIGAAYQWTRGAVVR